MLRNIGFGKAQTTNDLANCQFFIPERLDDPKALRMRKNLADFGVVLKERCVDLSARHEDNLLFQSFELSQLSDIHMPVSTLHRSRISGTQVFGSVATRLCGTRVSYVFLFEQVVHGAGLSLFAKRQTTLEQELAQLQAGYGVAYTACSNTMKAMKVTRNDLIDEVGDTVPAMVRLMERQEQGWAYIKP